MKYLIIAISIAISACGSGGGNSEAIIQPGPNSPFDPNKQYFKVSQSWLWVLSPYIEVYYSSDIKKLYGCDETFCYGSQSNSDKANEGECIYYGSYIYGQWKICYTDITYDLLPNEIWVSMEDLL